MYAHSFLLEMLQERKHYAPQYEFQKYCEMTTGTCPLVLRSGVRLYTHTKVQIFIYRARVYFVAVTLRVDAHRKKIATP